MKPRAGSLEGVAGKLRRFGLEPDDSELLGVILDLMGIAAAEHIQEPAVIGFGPYEPTERGAWGDPASSLQ